MARLPDAIHKHEIDLIGLICGATPKMRHGLHKYAPRPAAGARLLRAKSGAAMTGGLTPTRHSCATTVKPEY